MISLIASHYLLTKQRLVCLVSKFRSHADANIAIWRMGLIKMPEVVDLAEQAYHNLGRACVRAIVRGGTDGSQLTEKGLPTPNLSSGQHNIHSVLEFACLEEMVAAGEHVIELAKLWSQKPACCEIKLTL